jgi:MFS family permease
VTIGLFALFAASTAAFVTWERRRAEPLIDLRFFHSIPFSSAVLTALAGYASNGAFLFLITLYLQEVRHLSAFEAGLHTLPMAIAQIVCSNISGRLVGTRGTRLPLMLSSSALGLAAIMLTRLSPATPMLLILSVFLVYGIGQGLLNAPITTTAVSGMPPSQSGSAAGVTSTARQVGTSLGVAVAGTLTGLGAGSQIGSDFTLQTHRMWWTMLALMATIFALSWFADSAVGRRSRERIAHLLDEGQRPASAAISAAAREDVNTFSSGTGLPEASVSGTRQLGYSSTEPG